MASIPESSVEKGPTVSEATIGSALTKRREELEMSRVQAAEKVGMSRTTYSSYERDEQRPSVDVFPALAAFLNVTVEEFLVLYGATVVSALRPSLERVLAEQVMPANATVEADEGDVLIEEEYWLGPAATVSEVPQVPSAARIPEVPATPDVPDVPDVPEVPEAPAAPPIPDVPEVPEVLEVPEAPAMPEVPEAPVRLITETYQEVREFANIETEFAERKKKKKGKKKKRKS